MKSACLLFHYWREPPQGQFLSRQNKHVFVETNAMFFATKYVFCRDKKYACRDQTFVATKYFCCDTGFVATSILLSRVCRDKSKLVATKLLWQQNYVYRDKKIRFGSRQTFCRHKQMILVAAPAHDTVRLSVFVIVVAMNQHVTYSETQ